MEPEPEIEQRMVEVEVWCLEALTRGYVLRATIAPGYPEWFPLEYVEGTIKPGEKKTVRLDYQRAKEAGFLLEERWDNGLPYY